MIHKLFNLTRPLFVVDTETTGLTSEDRIIELGFQKWTSEGLVREWRSLINPGVPIPPSATEIHHITDDMMLNCQVCGGLPKDQILLEGRYCGCEQFKVIPFFAQIAKALATGFSDCDYAGKNVRFDLRKISESMKRCNIPWSYVGARIIDIDRLEALAIPRNLGALHEKYGGVPHDGAHGALSDVQASTRVICWQLEAHSEKLPRDLATLHEMQWPGWLTADGSFKLVNGVPTVAFGKYRDQPMEKVVKTYWDWILSNDFPADVKQLAADAKLGKFPTPTVEDGLAADKRMDQAL